MAGVGGELSLHPDLLLSVLTDRQWQGWQAFARHFGMPRGRGDLWSATVAHASAAPHVRRRLGVKDFMPRWGRVRKRQSDEDMKAAGQAWALRANRR